VIIPDVLTLEADARVDADALNVAYAAVVAVALNAV
jgi:hypothetical protein